MKVTADLLLLMPVGFELNARLAARFGSGFCIIERESEDTWLLVASTTLSVARGTAQEVADAACEVLERFTANIVTETTSAAVDASETTDEQA